MKSADKIKLIAFILGALFVLIGLLYAVVTSLRPKVAGIYIETNPSSNVWLNGREVGESPYRTTTVPGETIIKLTPNTIGTEMAGYETKVNLVAGVETVIRYDFAANEDQSAGEIISFEKNLKNETNLVAVSLPDSAMIIIDGRERAFTPYKTSSITPGEHTIKFSAQGYQDRIIKVKVHEGYKLTAIIKLSQGEIEATPSVTPTPEVKTEQVEILPSDMGYVRIRSEPSSVSDEIGRAEIGRKYKYLDFDEKTGWFKIEFTAEDGSTKSGWISNKYARKAGDKPVPVLTSSPAAASASATPFKSP